MKKNLRRSFLVCMAGLWGTCIHAIEPVGGWYVINNATELREFAAVVNGGKTGVKAKLNADIDLEYQEIDPIGFFTENGTHNAIMFQQSTFDGQGHTISNVKVNKGQEAVGADRYEGGLFGRLYGSTIKNLGIINADITNFNARCGVLCGFARNLNASNPNRIENCYVAGEITINNQSWMGDTPGAIMAGSNGGTIVTNCFATASSAYGKLYGGTVTGTNNFFGTDLTTGEACYKLNGSSENCTFFQTLGEDAYPTFDSTHGTVYMVGSFNCDGTSKGTVSFNNVGGEGTTDPHHFVSGECTVCLAEAIVDGYFLIDNAAALVKFSKMVNGGRNKQNAKLTADIDMTGIEFTPIARYDVDGRSNEAAHCYGGIFDGQGHEISNLMVVDAGEAGLFGRFSNRSACGNNGGCIKNLGIRNADITSTGKRAGVICGELLGNYGSRDMENCYVTGNVEVFAGNGQQEGGMTGESAHANMYNCYTTMGKLTGNDGGDVKVTNCYHAEGAGTRGTAFTAEQLASGELCYRLGSAFNQTIGTDNVPTLSAESEKVLYIGAAGYATFYDEAADWKLLGNAQAYIGKVQGEYLTLTEIADIPAETAVVLAGTYYNKVATTATANNTGNDLLGTNTDMAANGEYVLALKDEVVGFYKATTGTIAAGKAYLPAGSEAKVFLFAEDATAIAEIEGGKLNIEDSAIYNLAGQRIGRMQKGINIVGSKKVIK